MNGMWRMADGAKGIGSHTARQTIVIRSIYLLLLIAALPVLAWNGLVQQFNASLTDVLLRFRSPVRSQTVGEIVLVAIDDRTAARFGPLPLRRAVLAQGVSRLASFSPKTIALDLLVAEAGGEKDDAALAAALQPLSTVVLGAARAS